MSSDKIEKTVVLKAPRTKVWNAISDSQAFGTWFGMTLDGPFVAGATSKGKIAMTKMDPEVAKFQEPHVGMACDLIVETIEPEKRFAFRWHPGADPKVDADGPTTVVTFDLEEVAGGTKLTITESGFDRIPLERRAKTFAGNESGWQAQLGLIAKYVDGP